MAAQHSSFHVVRVPKSPRFGPDPTPVANHGRRPVQVAPTILPSTSPFALSPVAPPGAYSVTDTRITWMNGRPYLVHGLLGKGGFGEVFSVEMLLPVGLEVVFSENGDIEIDEKGCVSVTTKQKPEFGSSNTDLRPPPAEPLHFVYSSGVFLALKTQSARSAKELALLVKEVENLRFLTGEQGVVQIIDFAVSFQFLRLNFIMELGVGSFFWGKNFSDLPGLISNAPVRGVYT